MPSSVPVVVSGTELEKFPQIFPTWDFGSFAIPERKDTFVHTSQDPVPCLVVSKLASRLRLVPFEDIELKNGTEKVSCRVANIITAGSDEDSQIFVDLPVAQQLASLSSRIGLIQISVNGPPPTIQQFQPFLAQNFPEVDVRPVRQFTEGEARIDNRISRLLTATAGIVLVLTGLCVMASITHLAMDLMVD